jgi:OFA family oxalate/formate antiporter-like MFS transporter
LGSRSGISENPIIGGSKDLRYRWFIISLAIIITMTVSIYQYSWSLFAYNIRKELDWSLAEISLAFTIFQLANFSQPFAGAMADARGPKGVGITAALLVGLGFILSSQVSSPVQLCLCLLIGGVGVAALTSIAMASGVKWFPDKKGLASGLTSFGYGAGTAIFNWMIQAFLDALGFRLTFIYVGLIMLAILVPAALLFRYPPEGWDLGPGARPLQTPRAPRTVAGYRAGEMLRTRQWFVMYFSFTFTVSTVLTFAAQMKMIAHEFAIPQIHFELLLILFPLGNGISRIFGGLIADWIGTEKTMVIFFALLGVSLITLVSFGANPLVFVASVFLCALLGGSPFALYAAMIGDYFGTKYATTNIGITQTAKVWAGLISGWLCGLLVAQTGSYKLPLVIIAVCTLAAAFFSHPRLMKRPRPLGPGES